jgi:hypothetical protein
MLLALGLTGCGASNHLAASVSDGHLRFALCDPLDVNGVSVWASHDGENWRKVWSAWGRTFLVAPLDVRVGVTPNGMTEEVALQPLKREDHLIQVYFERRDTSGNVISDAWTEFELTQIPSHRWLSSTGGTRSTAC